MTATLPDVAAKKRQVEQSAEQRAAADLVRVAKEQGLSLTGPDGLLTCWASAPGLDLPLPPVGVTVVGVDVSAHRCVRGPAPGCRYRAGRSSWLRGRQSRSCVRDQGRSTRPC